jgi:hypothetical protein
MVWFENCEESSFSLLESRFCFGPGVISSIFNPSRSVLSTTLGDIIFDESDCELNDDLLGSRSPVVEVDSSDCRVCLDWVRLSTDLDRRRGPRKGECGTVTGHFGTFGTQTDHHNPSFQWTKERDVP